MDQNRPYLNENGLKFFFDQGKCQCDGDGDVWYATAASVATHSAAPANVTAVDVGDEKLLSDFLDMLQNFAGMNPNATETIAFANELRDTYHDSYFVGKSNRYYVCLYDPCGICCAVQAMINQPC